MDEKKRLKVIVPRDLQRHLAGCLAKNGHEFVRVLSRLESSFRKTYETSTFREWGELLNRPNSIVVGGLRRELRGGMLRACRVFHDGCCLVILEWMVMS